MTTSMPPATAGRVGRLLVLSAIVMFALAVAFWNDLLRNEDGVTYFSDATGGARRSITPCSCTVSSSRFDAPSVFQP